MSINRSIPPSSGYSHGYAAASKDMARRTAQEFADFLLPSLRPGMSVLDVGCGPGTITAGLAQAVAPGTVTGVDMAAPEVEKAALHATQAGTKNLRFQVADATALPFEDASFDAVFSCAVLEHIRDRKTAVREMYRVLKPGGVIGAKDVVFSGHLYGPPVPSLLRLVEIYLAVIEAAGADVETGRKLMPLLRGAGFVNLHQTARYQDDHALVTSFSRRIVEPSFVDQAERLGVSNREDLEDLAVSLSDVARDPDHYMHVAWGAVTGEKPA